VRRPNGPKREAGMPTAVFSTDCGHQSGVGKRTSGRRPGGGREIQNFGVCG